MSESVAEAGASPRVLAIEDYSEVGRCSLTVALPTISAMGVECVGLPTALFSNHTAFPSWHAVDLTSEILPAVRKWKELGQKFDLFYTGYLTTAQVATVEEALDELWEPDSVLFVDPAFADGGKLYPGFDESHVEAMRSLLKKSGLAKPNVTEAMFLTGVRSEPSTLSEAVDLAEKVKALGPKTVILSGISFLRGRQTVLLYDGKEPKVFAKDSIPGYFHGTGDLFSSVIAGAAALHMPLDEAVPLAQAFVSRSLGHNVSDGVPAAQGPCFEKEIAWLSKATRKALP
jgi:pyridoxine kinase